MFSTLFVSEVASKAASGMARRKEESRPWKEVWREREENDEKISFYVTQGEL